jgi:hypothetical protein
MLAISLLRNAYSFPSAVLLCGLLLRVHSEAADAPAGIEQELQPFLASYCLPCHNDKKQEGEFRLDTLSTDFTDQSFAQRWAEVIFRLNAGEMPPKKDRQPSPAELGRVVDWLSARIQEGEAARMAKRGPIAHYRLSREEYGHTVYDLLGVYFDVKLPGALNEDPRWHGFDRIGSLLTLSPSHVDRYFKAAETVIARAAPERSVAESKGRREANAGQEKWLQEQGLAGPVRWLLWPGTGQAAFTAASSGLYRIRIKLSGIPSFKGRLPHLSLWHQGLKRSVTGLDVLAAEDQPTLIEIEQFLPEGAYQLLNESPGMLSDGHTSSMTKAPFVSTQLTRPSKPTGYKLFTEDKQSIFPLLIVDWIEFAGPLLTDADRQKRELAAIPPTADLAVAREALQRFASRAWRRPATHAEIDRYQQLIENELAAGEKFPDAYRAALAAVLTSKNFYYLAEGSPGERRPRVNDWELASRLSYFLWSSLPDDELFAAAAAGNLHEPAVLRAQLTRMLDDAKIARFTDSFPRQWLQLHRVGAFPPDAELYPDYDKWLEESLVRETTGYFGEMFARNLPLREFLSSDWTIANPRLAMHYGLPAPAQTGFQRLSLRAEDQRGGILTHASILSLTSDGVRHRPVHRGVWVSEAIFGRTPPPPPPNVEPLEPTPNDKPKATIRQQIEAHATHAVCASCHAKIDPLGLAFDNYDAIGRWRTHERVAGGVGADPLVNAAGQLPDGRAYRNPAEFKQLLADADDRFASAFVEQLATYALRRVMTIDDAAQIQSITATCKTRHYPLRELIEQLVLSDLFQKR